jgi:hypothetical protein
MNFAYRRSMSQFSDKSSIPDPSIMTTRIFTFILVFFIVVIGIRCTKPTSASSPILVLATQENFGLFTAEILKTEGFNDFVVDSLEGKNISADRLQQYDIVILGETPLDDSQVEMFSLYVQEGGNLIAFRPDKKLGGVFGISGTEGVLSEGYLAVDRNSIPGRGIITETMQFHGTADYYNLSEAKVIATLYKDPNVASDFPAVVENTYGSGRAVGFLYNLPESIVLTRQGNYRDAGKEMDGILGIRAMDLFTNGWVNPMKNIINQADEQMRLLSHCIESLSADKRPLPRFWYFPDTLKCVVTLNNDGEDSKEAEFTPQFEDVDAKGAKMTLYIKEVKFVSKEWVDRWRDKGFEISGHPNDTKQAVKPDWNTMDSVYKVLLSELKEHYGVPSMQTVTNHWFVWVGNNADGTPNFGAQARIEELNGVGFDCNYAHYDNGSSHGHFLGEMGTAQGNYTGSGLAMKFADANGRIINVYQQLNNVYDQQYMEHKDQDGYYNAFKGLMDRSLDEEVFSTICVRAHNNEYFFSKVPLMKALDYANERGVPVWSEVQLFEFLKAKDAASFDNLSWSDDTLTFDIKSPVSAGHGITCMIPANHGGKRISVIENNGEKQRTALQSIKGFDYAFVTVKPGADYRMKVTYR